MWGVKMEVIYFKYFYELAKGISFAETSKKYSISESSLSKSIARLESELGCTLFNRKVRPMRPTDAGIRLMNSLDTLIPMYEDMISSLNDSKRVVRYTAINSLENYNLRNYCSEFLRENPHIDLVTNDKDTIKASPLEFAMLVENGEVDFVVMHDSIFIPPKMKKFYLKKDRIAVLMSKEHPFSKLDAVPPSELTRYPIIGPGCTKDISNELSHLCDIKCPVTSVKTNEIQLFNRIVNTEMISLFFSTDYMGYNLDNYGLVARPVDGVGSFPLILLSGDSPNNDVISDFAHGFKKYLDNLPSSQE